MPTPEAIRETLLQLAGERGPNKTFCPSEAARRLDADQWRDLMPEVHRQAHNLIKEGRLSASQKGQALHTWPPSGPYRLQKL